MDQHKTVKKSAARYLLILFLQRIIGLVLFIAASGTVKSMRGIVYFSLYFLISITAAMIMYRGHQETLNERGKKHKNTKSWDKVLLPVYVLLAYYGIYILAGLGIRFLWPQLSEAWMYAGIVLYLISGIFTVWPVVENKYFESTSRIQSNRGQTVVSTGPYRIVRHPGYLGILIWAASTAMIFGTLAVCLISAVIIAIIGVRTYLEDTMLKKELPGYIDYASKVKYRLIPYVW
ncbi:MAG TPA: isoprenylcysteine carboxylmethyltransferase family protein [Syntrophomonas sp.]|nr:isoprenylcysteine carboxylmethyltransferase family protein [Syntrophomonas sp.]